MIPISLKIKGVFSYKNEVEIDFTKLTRNFLFGIFGRVGAGKSAILESIMYVLYGEVSRLDNTRQTYNIMNLASQEFKIDFIFEHKKETYRCIVSAKRKKKNFNETDTPDFRYFRLVDSAQLSVDSNKHELSTDNYQLSTNWLPLKNFKAKEILGLEASHFRKTVIIPQNEFQEFIQMTTVERIRMIKDIFVDLEKYDLELKTKKLVEACNLQLALKQEKLKEVEHVTHTDLENIVSGISSTEKERTALIGNKQKFNFYWEEIIKVEKLHQSLKLLISEKEKLESQKAGMEVTMKNILLAEFFSKHIETPFALLEKNTETVSQTKITLEQKNTALNSILQKIQNIEIERAHHSETYKMRSRIEKLIEGQELYLQIVATDILLAPKQKEIETLTDSIGEINYEKRNAEEELKMRNEEYVLLLNNAHDLNSLTQLNNWYKDSDDLERRTNEIIHKNKKLDDGLETLQFNKNNIIETQFRALQIPIDTTIKLKETIEILKTREKELDKEQLEIAERVVQIKSNNRFLDAAKNLEDGKPCPLCGSIHHPDIFNSEEAHAQIGELNKLSISNKQLLDKCRSIELELERLMESAKSIQKEKKNLDAEQTEIGAQRAQHSNSFIWHTFDRTDRTKLVSAMSEAQTHNQKLKIVQGVVDKISQQITKLSQQKELFSTKKQNCEIELTRLKTKREELIQRILPSDYEKWCATDASEIERDIKIHKENLKSAIAAFENSEKEFVENVEARQKTQGSLAELEKQFQIQSQSLLQAQAELNIILDPAPLKTMTEWKNLGLQNFDLAAARTKLNSYNNAVSLNSTEIFRTEESLNGKIFLEESKLELSLNIQNSDIQIEENIRQRANFENQKTVVETQLKTKKETLEQVKTLEYRAENLKKLQNLFARSGFVNFVSTVYLSDLCRRTNQRFMPLTYNRLQIDINANNDFIVKDNMNGGEIRSIKSLSGGQLFQVSLSLALALAENIQTMYNTDQNFFFLDEGFGSLDTESLTIVFQFLKVLQKENRIVGIISHVAEMQDEIENYLFVTLDDEKGSEIETHY